MTKPLSEMSHSELVDACIKEQQRSADLAAHVERLRIVWGDLTAHATYESLLEIMEKVFADAPETSHARHPDDAAVDRFGEAMKSKLAAARAKGRDGWDNPDLCSAEFLATLLVGHIGKGNPGNLEDIAALAMMLHQRGDDPAVVAKALVRLKAEWQADVLEEAAEMYGHKWQDEFTEVVVDIMRKGRGYIYPEGLTERANELRRQAGGGE